MSCVWTLIPAWVPGLHKAEEERMRVTIIKIQYPGHFYNIIYMVNLTRQNKGEINGFKLC